jgi:hypothetical protein
LEERDVRGKGRLEKGKFLERTSDGKASRKRTPGNRTSREGLKKRMEKWTTSDKNYWGKGCIRRRHVWRKERLENGMLGERDA